ncbi:HYC_CC_PP family protein [Arenibacter latericius]|uniref:HYC_CC_PP family protein n=1 Tax=Arenibacter latericius TaxID=86104 RepID=UPI000425B680|nr:hypothetical protein [Arenibacter latericius]MDX1363392.1 hypothetical protein [Arenibacter latericius]
MKNIFQNIASLTLALLVLFSTMSFTLDMHYCGKTLIDYSVFNKVDTCGMETMQPTENDSCSIVVDNCCNEENITIEGQDILKNSFDKFSFHQLVFVATYAYSLNYLYEGEIENIVPFVDYSPPFLIRDIHVLYETFLI